MDERWEIDFLRSIVTNNPTNSELIHRLFVRRWVQNHSGPARARLARWEVLPKMAAQRVGLSFWVKAPLFWGPEMNVLLGENVSSGLLAFGYSETALTALLIELLKPTMSFVDVGAHLGYEAVLASDLVGESGNVVSFEPNPKIAIRTVRNLARFPQTRLVESAVGEKEGTLFLEDLELRRSAFARTVQTNDGVTVPVVTLDDAIREHERPVDIIKCDVEGAELSMLRGARGILANHEPLLILEAEMPSDDPARSRVREFASFLAPFNYRPLIFDFDGKLRVGSLGDFQPGHANIIFYPNSWRDRVEALRVHG